MVKVTRSKIMVPRERSWRKEYTCAISSGLKDIAKVKVFQKYVKFQGQGHKGYTW